MTDAEKLKKIEGLRRENGDDREALELLEKLIKLRMEAKKRVEIKRVPPELREKRVSAGEPLVSRQELVIDLQQAVRLWRAVESALKGQGIVLNEAHDPAGYISQCLEGKDRLDPAIKGHQGEGLRTFILLEVLKPLYETYAEAYGKQVDDATWVRPYCYVCGGAPDMAVLAGDGGKRYLCCGLCDTSWWYARLKCPHCGNEDAGRLVSISLEKEPAYVVHACRACSRYIKVVDARIRESLFIELEALRTSYLDEVAQREGFTTR